MRPLNIILAGIAIVFILSFKCHEATRILYEDEEELIKREHLLLPSLQRRRPVRPPTPSGCTFTPGRGGSPCSLGEKNFARHVMAAALPPPHPPQAYPQHILSFKCHETTRILDKDEKELMKREHLLLPSLQSRRPVRPPTPSGCTFTPGGGGGECNLGEKNFAGHVMAAAPPPQAYPQHILSFKRHEATRILDKDGEDLMKRGHLLLPSLQSRRPVRPPTPSGCTFTSGGGGSPCSLGEKNFASHVMAAAPPHAYPQHMVSFGVATGDRK